MVTFLHLKHTVELVFFIMCTKATSTEVTYNMLITIVKNTPVEVFFFHGYFKCQEANMWVEANIKFNMI